MLNCLLKTASVCFVILDITQAILPDTHDQSIEADILEETPIGNEGYNFIPNSARSLPWLGELRIRRDSENLTSPNDEEPILNAEVSNTEDPPPSDYDDPTINENANTSVYDDDDDTKKDNEEPILNADNLTSPNEEEPILDAEVSNTTNPPPSDYDDPTLNENAYTTVYADDDDVTKKDYCLWYNIKKKKEYKMHTGTHWSGNGCKLFHCIDGKIIPDPSCCEITPQKHESSLNYTLYQNHGERKIAACEVMVCNSGKIEKEKRIPGCCVYEDVKSIDDGEIWVAPTAKTSNNKQCNLGTCNSGIINVRQLEEGEVWGHGCFNYICENSIFQVNKVDLPGDCMTKHGNCITNGTTVKLWNECKGIMCVNGKLFKGFLPECSWKDKLLYRAFNHQVTSIFRK